MIRVNWIWFPRWRMMIVSVVLLWFGKAACFETEKIEISMATINYAYLSGEGSNLTFGPSLRGVYGLESKLEPERGTLVHVLTEDGANHACTPIMNAPKEGQWIALVQRGGCKFHSKIYTAGKLHNASAVIVYDNVEADPVSMAHNVVDIVSVFINKSDGERLVRLVDSGLLVKANITVGKHYTSWLNQTQPVMVRSRNHTMLITLLSFVGLLIVGLTGLLVYAVRRSHYVHKMNRPRMLSLPNPLKPAVKSRMKMLLEQHRQVFTLQEATQAQENLLPGEVAGRRDLRPLPRVRGPPPAWQPRWMPPRTLSTIPEDQQRSLDKSLEQV